MRGKIDLMLFCVYVPYEKDEFVMLQLVTMKSAYIVDILSLFHSQHTHIDNNRFSGTVGRFSGSPGERISEICFPIHQFPFKCANL